MTLKYTSFLAKTKETKIFLNAKKGRFATISPQFGVIFLVFLKPKYLFSFQISVTPNIKNIPNYGETKKAFKNIF